MFADFQNMIKNKISSIKQTTTTDITRTPQRYNIGGKSIQQIKLISEGSFGFIWLAEDTGNKQKYALKRVVCMNQQRLNLAKQQLQVMMKFPKSKNIVGCYGGQIVTLKNGNVDNKVLIILMQYCPNGTLFNLLESRQNKGFTQRQLLNIVLSILQGLRGVHSCQIFHLDVKIQNVLIGQDNSFKLCDFGSCSNKFIDYKKIKKQQYGSIRQQFQSITTPMYRPPQIVDPYLLYQVGYKADLWMVGCVLYTLAYFTHPFIDSNAIGIANGVVKFPKYPQQTKYKVSQKINDLIRNLLTPNPIYRFGIKECFHIINGWNNYNQIPLNNDAKIRKQQQKRKQKQLQKLNKKVVDIDGDIPLQQLLQIQKKLKNKTQTIEQSSFITSKSIQSIKEGSHKPNNQPVLNQKNTQKQVTLQANSFWNTNQSTKTNNKKNNTFESFNNFFTPSNEGSKKVQKKPDQLYDFFFPINNVAAQSQNKQKKVNNSNLLDL